MVCTKECECVRDARTYVATCSVWNEHERTACRKKTVAFLAEKLEERAPKT